MHRRPDAPAHSREHNRPGAVSRSQIKEMMQPTPPACHLFSAASQSRRPLAALPSSKYPPSDAAGCPFSLPALSPALLPPTSVCVLVHCPSRRRRLIGAAAAQVRREELQAGRAGEGVFGLPGDRELQGPGQLQDLREHRHDLREKILPLGGEKILPLGGGRFFLSVAAGGGPCGG